MTDRRLHIAFIGSSLTSSYWNGAATYYRGLTRALAALGHRVSFLEPDVLDRQAHRDLEAPWWAESIVYESQSASDVSQAIDRASDADAVIKCSGVGSHDDYLEREVLRLQDAGCTVAFLDVDAPATLRRVGERCDDPFRSLIPRYHLVLTYGGGPPVVDAYEMLGARACIPIYNAADPATHRPAERRESRFDGTLGFLGNRLPDRESRVHEFFLTPATQLPDQRFILGGSGWRQHALPPNVHHVGHVYVHEHNAFNCGPRAVLNISRDSMAAIGYSPATRVFEAAAAGACLITDKWDGIERFLEPGREVLVASCGREVVEILESLTEQRAAEIGAAARRRVLKDHTYGDRAKQLAEALVRASSRVGAS